MSDQTLYDEDPDHETLYAGESPDVVIIRVQDLEAETLEHYIEQARDVFGEETKLAFVDGDAADVLGVIQNGRWDDEGFTKYDRDPDALAWARGHVQHFVDKMRRFEAQAQERGDSEAAMRWRRVGNAVSLTFLTGDGCVIGAFDPRLPAFVDLFERAEG